MSGVESLGFLGGSDGNEPPGDLGDLGLIPGLGRSPGESPWTKEPGGLESMGLIRVIHD